MKFINFRLYNTQNLKYPPELDISTED